LYTRLLPRATLRSVNARLLVGARHASPCRSGTGLIGSKQQAMPDASASPHSPPRVHRPYATAIRSNSLRFY
ncbi:MAG: hypothetical protein ACREMY_18800, partial [bacterium]